MATNPVQPKIVDDLALLRKDVDRFIYNASYQDILDDNDIEAGRDVGRALSNFHFSCEYNGILES